MTVDAPLPQISIAISGATIFALLAAIVKVSMRFAALDVKVGTMWDFQMRRALSEAIVTGVGKFGSPLRFPPEVLSRLDPLKADLLAFNARLSASLSDVETLLLIEAEFGERLVTLVCIPCGLTHGACLLLAFAVMKSSDFIDLSIGRAPTTREDVHPAAH